MIADFIYAPFNCHKLARAPSRFDPDFADFPVSASIPIPTDLNLRPIHAKRIYNLLRDSDNPAITVGRGVYSMDSICPPVACPNPNIFGSSFGIKFLLDNNMFIHQISPFEHI